tara:strand:+ start:1201 stop:1470 length:270 start_codon:yes stop_codon:yes gene_type:complete
MIKKFKEWSDLSKILHAMVILGFTLAILMSIFSCEDVRVGKTREEIHTELYRTMFEVDSILMRIQYQLDTADVDGTYYIDMQRINNGHP